MESLAEKFRKITQKHYLTNITHRNNISSILFNGLLCYEKTKEIDHISVALGNVQLRREHKNVPNGMPLHRYASLYFAPRNPMMYYLKYHLEEVEFNKLIVLMIAPEVLEMDGVVITDGNAASNITRFFSPDEGLNRVDFTNRVYADWWTDDDPYAAAEKRRAKCAEILVPEVIPPSMIIGALVPTGQARQELVSEGFPHKVLISPKTFFC